MEVGIISPMRFIQKLFFGILLAFLICCAILAFNKVTDGFTLYQMKSSLGPSPQFEVVLSDAKRESLLSQLDHPFRYMGKGCQFFVFESEDGKLVIKFFKHKHLRPFTWLKKIPMPQHLRSLCNAKIERRKERVIDLFTSCKLAYEKIPEESGLLYIHLNRTPMLNKKITLIDNIGCKHLIQIDDYEYILQKKAIPIKESFSQMSDAELPQKVSQLADLVLARCQKGIRDGDPAFVQNVAFLPDEERAIYVDIGRFYEDLSIQGDEEQIKDLNNRLGELYQWTNHHFPHLDLDFSAVSN